MTPNPEKGQKTWLRPGWKSSCPAHSTVSWIFQKEHLAAPPFWAEKPYDMGL